MSTTLYVIGNGFDLHHGIRSAFRDFGRFLEASDSSRYTLLEDYFAVNDGFWSDFEARLADFDADTLIEHSSDLLVPYGAREWSDSHHHDYQFEIERVVEGLSTGLKSAFAKWIRQLEIPDPTTIRSKLVRLDTTATFLNFNYTPSLTTLYGVGPSQVLHIHGSATNPDGDLILGHGWNPGERGSSNDSLDLEETDTRVADGNRIIDQYFKLTYKPTHSVIAAHQSFFESLRRTRRIVVMGHSLADVDLPYFREITRHVLSDKVSWQISYHREDELPKLRRQMDELIGVPLHVVEFTQMAGV
jgi:hypothetical protein